MCRGRLFALGVGVSNVVTPKAIVKLAGFSVVFDSEISVFFDSFSVAVEVAKVAAALAVIVSTAEASKKSRTRKAFLYVVSRAIHHLQDVAPFSRAQRA